ncbi:kinesin-like protein KIF2C [Pogoniulus pusillus]|uniref:kinesin-like protein KIF2C n=1 Tax=Pogoniulus pusillus TaxID=488313 RepID=UPI0030B92AC2
MNFLRLCFGRAIPYSGEKVELAIPAPRHAGARGLNRRRLAALVFRRRDGSWPTLLLSPAGTMDARLCRRICPGLSINIQRSNGLIHKAIVMTVSVERASVCVEWSEENAVKGKEVDFAEVIAINPELLEELPTADVKENLPLQGNVTVQKHKRRTTLSKIPAPRQAARGYSRMSVINAGSQLTLQEEEMEVNPCSSTQVRNSSTLPAGRTRASRTPQASLTNGNTEDNLPAAKTNPSVSPVQRRPSIVTAMEKRKSKREERRVQNNETRTKRAQEFDSNCPNWEFAQMIKEFKATLDCHPVSMIDPIEQHRISVCVRKRPLNKQERLKNECDVITVQSKCVLLVHEPKQKVDLTKYLETQTFRFDFAFDESSSNEMVYRFTARPLVETIFEGGKATCFAYGQTGSGKTHTMGGDFSGKAQNASKGIYAFASQDVFLLLNQPRYRYQNLEIYVTFFEIYNGKVFDLLNKKAKLRVLEDGKQQVQVVGLQERQVSCAEDVIRMIEIGSACRTSGQTFANASSSRSHACFQILVRQRGKLVGKFSLVDLAGNERGADTCSADWQTRMEAAEINKSLLSLKECIRALGQNKSHTPFRESKLTQVLRDSFIGTNSRTCMIAMISPGMSSCEYTLNTLRYADRVKELSPHNGVSEAQNQMETEENETSGEGSGFQCNLSKDEEEGISPHMLNLREAMTQITECEDKAVEQLRELRPVLERMATELEYLLGTAEKPDYDLKTFVSRAKHFVEESSENFLHVRETLDALGAAMQLEEQASKQMSWQRRY